MKKILFAGDAHKTERDFSSMAGSRDFNNKMVELLYDFIIENEITHFVCLGDWYHKGYRESTSKSFQDLEMEFKIYKAVNGNMYKVIGNHLYHNFDSNPSMFLAKHLTKPRDEIIIDRIKISFIHNEMDIGIKDNPELYDYHVGCLHVNEIFDCKDESVAPQSILNIASKYKMDSIISGHLHTPMTCYLNTSDKYGWCKTPGSLGVSSVNDIRPTQTLPVLNVLGDGKFSWDFYTIDKPIDMIKVKQTDENKVNSTRGNGVEKISNASIDDIEIVYSLGEFLRNRQYTHMDIEFIKTASKGVADTTVYEDIYKNQFSL